MDIQITPEALKKLAPYRNQDTCLLLDLDDGVGIFSKLGVCSLDTSFRILAVQADSNLKDYPIALTAPEGNLYIKAYTKDYFSEQPILELDPRFPSLRLKSAAGVIDNHVEIIDLRELQKLKTNQTEKS